ncbi:hypothetical protein DMC30DRAFT_132937 [Rhodotorula diobovata]|uniref:Endonuclease/exonuclease/phosphatase domain-containing protein n=1 Tax=Rhodotorula diobovata TaxID=5288 RepID=A0A5C5FKL1_9BASI|nr:hypothetical protein DMC30DRAFT_132937 [Rhodotorula diobovata]
MGQLDESDNPVDFLASPPLQPTVMLALTLPVLMYSTHCSPFVCDLLTSPSSCTIPTASTLCTTSSQTTISSTPSASCFSKEGRSGLVRHLTGCCCLRPPAGLRGPSHSCAGNGRPRLTLRCGPSHNVVALDLHTSGQSVCVIGAHNPHRGKQQNAMHLAGKIIVPLHESTPSDSLVVIAGDFSLHHLNWDPGSHYSNGMCSDVDAQLAFARFSLAHLLPSASLTFCLKGHAPGAIDLVLSNLRVKERVVSCAILPLPV